MTFQRFFFFFFFLSFFLSITHNSKTIGCMPMFYICSECSTIGDLPFLVYNYVQVMTTKLQPQTCITVSFWHAICAYFKYNLKNSRCLQIYYTPNDFSTTKDALFYVKSSNAVATYKLQPIQTSLSCYLVCKYEWQQNSGHLRLYYNTVTIVFLPRLHPSEGQTEVRLMSCHPAAIVVSLHYM